MQFSTEVYVCNAVANPLMVAGVPRTIAVILGLSAIIMACYLQSVPGVLVLLALYFICAHLSKKDPIYLLIIIDNMKLKNFYEG